MKARVGQTVWTKWDDSKALLAGIVVKEYRSHRGKRYRVQLENGAVESVEPSQVKRVR